jgi:hypothetical protein
MPKTYQDVAIIPVKAPVTLPAKPYVSIRILCDGIDLSERFSIISLNLVKGQLIVLSYRMESH